MLLPSRCPVCGALGAAPCASCAAGLVAAPALAPVPGCASVAACWRYDGVARPLLLGLKYHNRRDPVPAFAAALAATAPPVDLVTWAPTSAARVRERGFDQAEALARAVGRVLGRPVHPTLRRVGRAPQTGRDARARRAGPAFARHRRAGRVAGARVLLVDDIITTGATFAHAAAALAALGPVEVHARAVCATPRPTTIGTSVISAAGRQVAS